MRSVNWLRLACAAVIVVCFGIWGYAVQTPGNPGLGALVGTSVGLAIVAVIALLITIDD